MSLRAPALVALASLAFASLGLPDGVLGVAWPSIRATWTLPLDALGALLVAYTSGYVVSSFVGGRLSAHMGLGGLLAASCLATGLSLFGYAASPWWPLLVAFGLVAGLGAGGIDTGVNAYAAAHHGPRLLNWLHACYGLGAVSGPAIVTALLATGRSWRWGYASIAALQVALAIAFAATRRAWPAAPSGLEPEHSTQPASIGETLRVPRVWLGVLLFVAYTGLELATGIWAYTVLTQDRGIGQMMAGTWTALYWAGLTVGRLIGSAAAGFVGATFLLRMSLAALTAGLTAFALADAPALLLTGLVLAGVGAGPVFPTMIAATPARVGSVHAANAVGFQISGAALGQAAVPWLLGAAGVRLGTAAIAWGLPIGALLVIALHEAVARQGARAGAPVSARRLASLFARRLP